MHLRYIALTNGAISARPSGMAVTTHLCRGNFKSSWVASGGYDFVAEALFNELNVDGFFLEYDDEQSGGFEPLRFVPPGKQVVLGLVTTKRLAHPRGCAGGSGKITARGGHHCRCGGAGGVTASRGTGESARGPGGGRRWRRRPPPRRAARRPARARSSG